MEINAENLARGNTIVKCVFTLLGIGFLLPWNAFISASEYFETRIQACTSGSVYEENKDGGSGNDFMLWFGLVYNISGVVSLAGMLISQKRQNRGRVSNSLVENSESNEDILHRRRRRHPQWTTVITALSCFFLTMLLTTSMVLLPSSFISPKLFRTLSILSASICGTAGAFISTGIVAFASDFPPHLAIQPFISGQAVGGVVISILNYVMFGMERTGADAFWKERCNSDTMDHSDVDAYHDSGADEVQSNGVTENFDIQAFASHQDLSSCEPYHFDWGAFCYFLIGTIFIATCMGLYIYVDQSPVTRYYRNQRHAIPIDESSGVVRSECLEEGTGIDSNEASAEENETVTCDDPTPLQNAHIENNESESNQENSLTEPLLPLNIEEEDLVDISTSAAMPPEDHTMQDGSENLSAIVWKCVRKPAISIFVTFFITITIFPSWITKLESVHECQDPRSRFQNDLFVPALIVVFNVCDLIGRASTGCVILDPNQQAQTKLVTKWLSIASYARSGFLPIFLLCSASDSAFVPPIKIFYNDFYPLFFTAILAASNGFVSTLSFIQAAMVAPVGEEVQQVASTILNFAVGLGLMIGSFVSFLYNYIGTSQIIH